MDYFCALSPEQLELLALLSEECGEVVQMIGKIMRHGLYSHHPDGGPDNQELLGTEIGDIMASVQLLLNYNVIVDDDIQSGQSAKLRKLPKFLHHAKVK